MLTFLEAITIRQIGFVYIRIHLIPMDIYPSAHTHRKHTSTMTIRQNGKEIRTERRNRLQNVNLTWRLKPRHMAIWSELFHSECLAAGGSSFGRDDNWSPSDVKVRGTLWASSSMDERQTANLEIGVQFPSGIGRLPQRGSLPPIIRPVTWGWPSG
jgi:hypothetical protein